MSMHNEFERAVTGSSPKKGLSALGWLFVSLGMFAVLGVVGVGFAMNRVSHKVEAMLAGFDYDAAAAATKVVARLESHARLLSADPDQGLDFLRNMEGEDPTQAFLRELFDGSVVDRARLGNLEDLSDLADLADLADPTD